MTKLAFSTPNDPGMDIELNLNSISHVIDLNLKCYDGEIRSQYGTDTVKAILETSGTRLSTEARSMLTDYARSASIRADSDLWAATVAMVLESFPVVVCMVEYSLDEHFIIVEKAIIGTYNETIEACCNGVIESLSNVQIS